LFYVLQEQNLCSGHDVPEHLRVTKLPINTNFASKIAFAPVDEQSSQHRLQEARRLMLGEHLDAASAGYRVGYDNPRALQPGVQKSLRPTAAARCGTAAGSFRQNGGLRAD